MDLIEEKKNLTVKEVKERRTLFTVFPNLHFKIRCKKWSIGKTFFSIWCYLAKTWNYNTFNIQNITVNARRMFSPCKECESKDKSGTFL